MTLLCLKIAVLRFVIAILLHCFYILQLEVISSLFLWPYCHFIRVVLRFVIASFYSFFFYIGDDIACKNSSAFYRVLCSGRKIKQF